MGIIVSFYADAPRNIERKLKELKLEKQKRLVLKQKYGLRLRCFEGMHSRLSSWRNNFVFIRLVYLSDMLLLLCSLTSTLGAVVVAGTSTERDSHLQASDWPT